MAYTQVDDLPLLQLASLGGIAAVSFVVAWVAAWLELALSVALGGTPPRGLRQGIAVAAVFVGAHAWGVMRLNAPLDDVSVRVATVGTPAGDVWWGASSARCARWERNRGYTSA